MWNAGSQKGTDMRPLTALMILIGLPAGAGEMAETCMIRDQLDAATCDCIEQGLRAELGPEDFATYLRVSGDYFDGLDAGLPRAEAWDNAVKAEAAAQGIRFATLLTRTNQIGRLHADAIKSCRS